MTKSPEQLAEALARKCALEIEHMAVFQENNCSITTMSHKILQTIPLKELLECADLLNTSKYLHPNNCICHACKSLTNLTTAIKSILGEDGV